MDLNPLKQIDPFVIVSIMVIFTLTGLALRRWFFLPYIAVMETRARRLEDAGVDLVLTGHSHSYERSFLLDGHYGPSWTFGPGVAMSAVMRDARMMSVVSPKKIDMSTCAGVGWRLVR